MSDLIERSEVLKQLRLNHKDVIYIDKVECARRIEAIPPADAVEVVRCKDCVFSKVYQNDSSGVMGRFCEAFTQVRMVTDDDFCSYGEREGE